jgi:hypothetical protein
MCRHVLFHVEWRVTAYSGWIITGDYLIFFLFSLLTCNVYYCPICFLLLNFSPRSINFLFCSFFIYRSFYYFQFSPSIAIFYMFCFSFGSSFFEFVIFSLALLLKFFFFQFHPSIKTFVILSLTLILLIFFILLKLFLNSIKPSS